MRDTSHVMSATGAPTDAEAAALDAHWRAANCLSVGQICLLGNPLLLVVPLEAEHIKPRLLGHWGTSSGLNLDPRTRGGPPGSPRLAWPG